MTEMKKTIKIFAVGLLVAGGFSSCANLDMDDDGRLTMDDIFSRYDRTQQYLNGILNDMPKVTLSYGATSTPMLAGFSDEAQDANDGQGNHVMSNWYNGAGSAADYASFPLTAKTINCWEHYYEAIYKANMFLENMLNPSDKTFPFDETMKTGWIAQVRVARAYQYLMLAKRYGGVPIVDGLRDVNHDYSGDRRASFEEVADYIISECDLALSTPDVEGGFTWITTNSVNLTRFVAWAIKSQTALYAASPLFNNGSSKYTWAVAADITKQALDECLAHGARLYDKTPEASSALNVYDQYFLTKAEATRGNDPETILQSTTQLKIWQYCGTPMNGKMKEAGACPSQELVDCYDMKNGQEAILGYSDDQHLQPIINQSSGYDDNDPYKNRDPRFEASIYYNGCQRNLNSPSSILYTYEGSNCALSTNVTDVRFTRTGYYMRKFNSYTSDDSHAADGYMPLFRLAELYLNFAEAAYQSSTPDTKFGNMSAVDAVNAVRARVGMAGFPTGMNKSDFERRYRKERRVELAFEDHRYYDVRRWKILEQTDGFVTGMQATKNSDGSFSYKRFKLADRRCNTPRYYFYPIVQEEVSKMLQQTGDNWQNPNW